MSAERLFQTRGIWGVEVSPTGEWVIAHAIQGDVHGLLVQKLGSQQVTPVFVTNDPLERVDWVGADSLVIRNAAGDMLAGSIQETDDGVEFDWKHIRAPGWYVDPLLRHDGSVIWEFEYRGYNSIHRVEIQELLRYREKDRTSRSRIELGESLARVKGSAVQWLVDREGVPRAYVTQDEGSRSVMTKITGRRAFEEVYRFEEKDEEAAIYPLAVEPEADRLIVLAYKDSDTRGLYEFDMTTGEVGKKIYERIAVDVIGGIFDPIGGELIAAVYEEGGERRFHYLETYARDRVRRIQSEFPAEELAIVSRSADREIYILFASSSTNPGTYYLRNDRTGEMIEVARVATALDPSMLSEVETIDVESADGTHIEAFLALPRNSTGSAGAPLIVNPHGGPIGVRDNKHYDPFIQYLTSWGFATLQVNYRGSSGYGRRFEEAGKREWAQGIEDDIDAAVEAVSRRPEVDGKKVCIVGGSYGGFSALASIVRHPGRYRCAVTLNGVTDIPLSFETSDFADSERVLEGFAEVVGDVESERERLIDISPLYHVEKMQVPIFVIYGTEDRRVDPDHSHRLLLMLETLGKQHEVLELEGAEHSPTRREWIIASRAIRRFVSRHLHSDEEIVEDPQLESDGHMELPTVGR